MKNHAENFMPTDGEVKAVRGSPGPAAGISIDVYVRDGIDQTVWLNVKPVNLPQAYDVIIREGDPIAIQWRGGVARVWSAFEAVTTQCAGGGLLL